MYIYKITNLINGKIYIGQTTKIDPDYFGSGLLISYSIKKYGKENFKKEILEYCTTKEELNNREKYWIKELNSQDKNIGYNIAFGGEGGRLCENEWKKGKTYDEVYGVEKSTEIKRKFSEKRKGKSIILKNITRDILNKKISDANKGKLISDDKKHRISNTLKEFYKTEPGVLHKEKIRENNKIRIVSDETRKKQSETMKGRRPKKLDVHPTSQYWYFYDNNNNLIHTTLGNGTFDFKKLNTNWRHIKKFKNLQDC